MRRDLFAAAFALIAAVGVAAQSGEAAPAKSTGAFALYANVGSGWWGGTDFEQFITDYQAVNSTLKASNNFSYSVGMLDRLSGNPLYLEFGFGVSGFTGGWDTNLETYTVSYFSFPVEMSFGLMIPMGKTIALMAQAGLLMSLHMSADTAYTYGGVTDTSSLESETQFSFLALSIPIAAGIEITLSPSFKMDILAVYNLGFGDINFLDFTSTGGIYWSNLTENQFAVRCSLVFPFAPPKSAGQPSAGNGPIQR